MKLIIASDLHGNARATKELVSIFEREGADKLILLGDLYYHGPRNPLPDGYAPKEVASMLNAIKDKLLVVRGNCDADVDLMISEFPFHPTLTLSVDGKKFFMSHGNVYSPTAEPAEPFDVMLYGHTHVAKIGEDKRGRLFVNPGSVTFSVPPSYIVYQNQDFAVKELYK